MSPFAFMQIDRERALLIDHIGGCERILKTPLPKVYSIKIRRVLVLFLITLPFVLLSNVNQPWLIPLITVLIAYPLISMDQIGHELQNPFATTNLSQLPLKDISATIEQNILSLREMPGQGQPQDQSTSRPASNGNENAWSFQDVATTRS